MQYNTQQKRMPLPEYGRSIQNMVDYALTIQDRAERQRCANTIINKIQWTTKRLPKTCTNCLTGNSK